MCVCEALDKPKALYVLDIKSFTCPKLALHCITGEGRHFARIRLMNSIKSHTQQHSTTHTRTHWTDTDIGCMRRTETAHINFCCILQFTFPCAFQCCCCFDCSALLNWIGFCVKNFLLTAAVCFKSFALPCASVVRVCLCMHMNPCVVCVCDWHGAGPVWNCSGKSKTFHGCVASTLTHYRVCLCVWVVNICTEKRAK